MERNLKTEVHFQDIGNIAGGNQTLFHVHAVSQHLKEEIICQNIKFHSEAAKRKAEESAELVRMKLLNADKVPHLSDEHQTGGAVSTRGMKR